ncbi:hypothetical protein HUT03_05225 [Candidatus Liberibacter africanus]|nr:hypothetical protein [Candidatus Liberibacter africanus]QTP64318.1 hypothetical protein HUT03_05225 [Candidatus Liberibacter africanus]
MGEQSKYFHIDLTKVLSLYNISHIWLHGTHILALKDVLSHNIHVHYSKTIEDFFLFIQASLIDGDVIVVKSSYSCGFHRLVKLLLEEFSVIS